MQTEILFPFAEYWWFYASFTGFILTMLLIDLGVFQKEAHAPSFREASMWTVIWVLLALAFNFIFYQYSLYKFSDPVLAKNLAMEFLAGYIIEQALSVDNMFVFVMVFSFFHVPTKYQHRVLFFGILGALIFRAIFIALGTALLQYEFVVMFFGALLIITGLKILLMPEKQPDPEKNFVIKFLKKTLPLTPKMHGQKFWIRENGKFLFTPLFITLAFVEISDVIFAIDSVPAIFGITREPVIVFTSNVMAVMGLRSMYFLLAGIVDKFHFLKYGLGFVLVFVGCKMSWLNHWYGGKFPISWSLAIIIGMLGISVIASLALPKKHHQ